VYNELTTVCNLRLRLCSPFSTFHPLYYPS